MPPVAGAVPPDAPPPPDPIPPAPPDAAARLVPEVPPAPPVLQNIGENIVYPSCPFVGVLPVTAPTTVDVKKTLALNIDPPCHGKF